MMMDPNDEAQDEQEFDGHNEDEEEEYVDFDSRDRDERD